MSGPARCAVFAGWAGLDSGPDPRARLAAMLGVAAHAPGFEARWGERWALAVLSGTDGIALRSVGGWSMVTFADAASRDDPQRSAALASALSEKGVAALRSASERDGSMLVAVDEQGDRLLAGFDRFATWPVFHANHAGGVIVGGFPGVVARHHAVGTELDHQAVYNYIYATAVPAPRSVFRSVKCLLPGHALCLDSGSTKVEPCWAPAFEEEPMGAHPERRAAEVVSLLADSVDSAVETATGEVGCFLSGGIDSSTVAGLLSRRLGPGAKAFSIGFDAEGYDELGYARIVARHFGLEHHEYYVTPGDIVALIPEIAPAYGQPFGNSSVIPTFHCARLAANTGVGRLLAGDGGDELFGGNERYASQYVLSLYSELPSPVRGILRGVLGGEGNPLSGLPLVRKACSYVRQASTRLPDRLDTYNYLNQLGAQRLLTPEFLADVDADEPLREKRALFDAVPDAGWLNRLLALDYKITLADNDLPKVSVMANHGGVQVRYPFLDRHVVDFASRLPAVEKVRRTRLRAFFKSAVSDLLPQEVLSKSKHGFGLPFGTWLTQDAALKECVYDLLAGCRERGIVAPEFIDALQGSLIASHPRYYGPLVWTLIMLESWLRHDGRTHA